MNIFQRHQTLPLPILWKAIPPEEWYEEAHVHPHRWVLNLYSFTFYFSFCLISFESHVSVSNPTSTPVSSQSVFFHFLIFFLFLGWVLNCIFVSVSNPTSGHAHTAADMVHTWPAVGLLMWAQCNGSYTKITRHKCSIFEILFWVGKRFVI